MAFSDQAATGAGLCCPGESGRRLFPIKVKEISGIVLAGGKSRRMGTKKSELKLGGRTLLEIQVRKLQKLGVEDIMISGYDEPVGGTRALADIYPDKGPLGGVHACLLAAEKPACLVLSVDVPLIPEEVLETLVQAHEGGVTMLAHDGKTEPLLAVYDADLAARAESLILSDIRAMRALADSGPVRKVEYTGDLELLLNCNTPEDYEKAKRLWK